MSKLFVAVIAVLGINLAFATSQSRVYLARADAQLASALENVQKAKDADKSQYVQTFHYKDLNKDISSVRKGIQDYLNNSRELPSNIEVLKAKYKD